MKAQNIPPKKSEEKNQPAGAKPKRRGRMLKRSLTAVVMGVVILGIIAAFSSSENLFDRLFRAGKTPTASVSPTSPVTPSPTSAPTPTPEPDLRAAAVVTCVGDIILHKAVIEGGLQPDGTYQYEYIFNSISSCFDQSDYTVANYEGALYGPPYTGYPMFNAPDAIADALKRAGVEMVTTANNHAFDGGLEGMKRTPQVFAEKGIQVIGTRSSASDPCFQIADINGIRVGFTGYTYETPGDGSSKALNGMILPAEANALVDSFNPYRAAVFEKNKTEMAERIRQMREAGAECVIFVLHWGEEYKTASNGTQQALAKYLSDQGVDVIIGHHPHVLQEIAVLSSAVTGKDTLVYYSVGNFLANMGFRTQGTNGYAEDALIARVTIERDKDGNTRVTKGEYIDTYVDKKDIGGKRIHTILPVKDALASPAEYGMEERIDLLKNSAARTAAVMANNQTGTGSIVIQEYAP